MSNRSEESRNGMALLVIIGILLALLLFVPLLTAFIAFYFARPYLGKKESWAMLLVGIGGFALLKDYTLMEYVDWIKHSLEVPFGDAHGSVIIKEFPWVGSLLLSLTFTGALNLLGNTRFGSTFDRVIPDRPTGKVTFRPSKTKSGQYIDEILDAEKRQELLGRASVVAPPGQALLIDTDDHSVFNEKVGERKFPIGRDVTGQPIMLSEKEIGTHGVILGSTGSGKTETIKALAGGLLDLGWTGTILDLKEDTAPGGLRDWCVQYADHHSIPYQELHLSDANSDTWFNSLDGMGPDEMRDSILAAQHFEAAYYEALNKELLGQLVNAMYFAHQVSPDKFPYPTLYALAKICGSPNITTRTRDMVGEVLLHMPHLSKDDFSVLLSPSKAQQETAIGFGSRLGQVFDTQAGRAVLRDNADGTKNQLDITKDGLTYVGLDSLGKADLTRVLSSAMLQRMSVYASQRTTGAVARSSPRFIIVDEANWVNREIVKNLLSRARSAGIALILATQGPRDWIDQQGEDWDTLGQNLNMAIIMKQGAPDSALLCSEYLGKTSKERKAVSFAEEEAWLTGSRRMKNSDGNLVSSYTVSEELDYRVPPDTLRELRVGEAFVRVGSPEFRVDYAAVAMRDPKASPGRSGNSGIPFR